MNQIYKFRVTTQISFLKYRVFPSVSSIIFSLMGIGDFNRPLFTFHHSNSDWEVYGVFSIFNHRNATHLSLDMHVVFLFILLFF